MKKECLTMKEIQEISLEILKIVTDICDKIGCRYSLVYGTLIGAIRHKDYIPWDDDVDIMMPRPDYEKLLNYLSSPEVNIAPLAVFNRETNKNYIYGITRICDTRYEIFTENMPDCGMGIFIDVYPYDGLGNDYNDALDRLTRSSQYMKEIVFSVVKRLDVPKSNNWKGKLSFTYSWLQHHFWGPSHYYKKQEEVFKGLSGYDSSKYVGPLAWFFAKPERVLFEKDLFDDLIKVPFGKYMFYVPRDYDKLLSQEYGDYMQLPPVEKRIYHHQYKAYKK